MSATSKRLVIDDDPAAGYEAGRVLAVAMPAAAARLVMVAAAAEAAEEAVEEAAKDEAVKAFAVIKHVAMVIAAPFIGLLFILLFPFIGLAVSLAVLLWMAGKASVTFLARSPAAPAKAPAIA